MNAQFWLGVIVGWLGTCFLLVIALALLSRVKQPKSTHSEYEEE